jgi:hypothetical protein
MNVKRETILLSLKSVNLFEVDKILSSVNGKTLIISLNLEKSQPPAN